MPPRIKIFFLFFTVISIFSVPSAFAQLAEAPPSPAPAVGLSTTEIATTSSREKSAWNFQGELVFDVKANQKPTGVAGVANAQVPWLGLMVQREFNDETILTIEAMAATPTTGTTEINFRQVSARMNRVIGESTDLEAGLISNAAFASAEVFALHRRVGPEFQFPLQRYGYLPDTDYGIQVLGRVTDMTTLAMAVTNGEGRGQSETGTRKDFAFWLSRQWKNGDRGYLVTVFGSRGAYENLPVGQNSRDRAQVRLATLQNEGWSGSFEYNWAWDAADGVHNVAADKVNLTSLAGTNVQAVGYAGHLNFAWKTGSGKTWSVFSRTDRWEPVKGDGNLAIASSQIGVGYKPRTTVQWLLYNSLTTYGQLHSTAARDQQSWRVTLDLKFD